MAEQRNDQPSQPSLREQTDPTNVKLSWAERRRNKIVEEIQRNRRGEYTVPTWVLVVILVALLGGWLALILA